MALTCSLPRDHTCATAGRLPEGGRCDFPVRVVALSEELYKLCRGSEAIADSDA